MRGLLSAAKNGDLTKATTILSREGLNVNAVDEDGRSALHYAVKGHLGVAEQLLIHNADPNLTDSYRATPLHRATDGHYKLVDLLLKNKAKVNVENEWGYVPLHEAALKGHSRIIELLVDNKADVNHQNQYGDSPLHFACQRGHSKVVTGLLSHKAFPSLKNNDGKIPLDKAREKGYLKVVAIFENQVPAKKRTQSMVDWLVEEEAKQIQIVVTDDDAEKADKVGKVEKPVKKPLAAVSEEAVREVELEEIWTNCRHILESENLTMNEWHDIRAKLKETFTKQEWRQIKVTDKLKRVKKKCKKHLRQQYLQSDEE